MDRPLGELNSLAIVRTDRAKEELAITRTSRSAAVPKFTVTVLSLSAQRARPLSVEYRRHHFVRGPVPVSDVLF
jgi:hypothetical protein